MCAPTGRSCRTWGTAADRWPERAFPFGGGILHLGIDTNGAKVCGNGGGSGCGRADKGRAVVFLGVERK